MASLIKNTALEPLITGPILLFLLRASPEVRARFLAPPSNLPAYLQVSTPTAIAILKGLFSFGILRRINDLLNRFAFNNWKLNSGAMAWHWPEEICVITGGSGGIGSVLAARLAETGMKVAIIDLSPLPPALQSLSNVSFFECDITDQDSVKRTATAITSKLGEPSILINNAGLCRVHSILDMPDSYLKKVFGVNLLSHWYTVQAFLPAMLKARKGHVVTIASMASYTTVAGFVDYCATKTGALAFHEGLTQELKHRYNAPYIRTTSVHPFWVQTPLIVDFEGGLKAENAPRMSPEYVAGEIAKAVLSGRSGQLVLPNNFMMNAATSARGWATWMRELVNDSTKEVTRAMSTYRS